MAHKPQPPMAPSSVLKSFLVGLFCCATLGTTAAPKWSTLQAPHCLIVSQLSESETRAWATQFEQFNSALRGVLTIDDRLLPPVTVVLFADSGTFKPYYPLDAKGRKREVAGFFGQRETWGVIGLANGFSDDDTRRTVLHEATHWLVSATPTQLPLWLNEGFAEVFSSFEAKKDHGILGRPIAYHAATLKREKWLPFHQLLYVKSTSPLYTDNNRNAVYYAQSWLFVHRLLFADRAAGYETLNRFFTAQSKGAGPLAAFEAAFGKDPAVVETELERYFQRGGFGLTKLPFPPEAKIDAPFQPAPEAVVAVALARVALASGQLERARTHLDNALVLAPDSPAPHEVDASLRHQLDDAEGAATAAQRALDLGSRDAAMRLLVASKLWRLHQRRGTLDTVAREIADHLGQALALQPKLRTAYVNLAQIARLLPEATVGDARLLVAGLRLYPDAVELLVGLAHLQHKAGNAAEAQRFLGMALAQPDALGDTQRIEIERLRTTWKIEPIGQQIDALAKDGKFVDATALCEAVLKEPLQIEQRRQWEKRLGDLRFQAAFQAAERTADAGDSAGAIAALEELAAKPDLSPYQTRQIRRLLERLRENEPAS